MRGWLCWILFIFLFKSAAFAEETIRIAIVEKAQKITLSGSGLEVRNLHSTGKYVTVPGERSVVYLSSRGMMLDGNLVDGGQGVKFRSQGFVRVAEKPVRGQIEIRQDKKGLAAINILPLEAYLMAVLGSEMPHSFPLEALKAQAVASRTYALRRKIDSWGKPYHLGATVLHQVYGGAAAEDERTREVVYSTRGQVLTWKMEPIEAYFHSNCGGHTENGKDALGRPLPYLKSVSCNCRQRVKSDWRIQLSSKDLNKLAKGVKKIQVVERTITGRAKRVSLRSLRASKVVSAVDLRRIVGYSRIKSLDFRVEGNGHSLILSGKGFGHGAGLCQWGAKAYAEKGWDYVNILKHYYNGAKLVKMY